MKHSTTINKQFVTLGLGIFLLMMAACSKLIDTAPPNNTLTTQQLFTSNALVKSAMAGVYALMADGESATSQKSGTLTMADITLYPGLAADEFVPHYGIQDPVAYSYYTNKVLITDATSEYSFWKFGYKMIYNINSVIEGVNASSRLQVDDTVRVQTNAQCKFFRGFINFYLTNLYGDIPLALTSDYHKNALLARSPREQVYQQIETDLREAMDSLPDSYIYGGVNRNHVTRSGAAAMLARVYLYEGKWQEAAAMADAVISNPQYALATAPEGVFLKNSQEAILQFTQSGKYNSGENLDAFYFMPSFRMSSFPPDFIPFLILPDQWGSDGDGLFFSKYCVTDAVMNAFGPGDKRRAQWLDTIYTPDISPYFSKLYYYPVKYPDAANNPSNYPYMVLRLAEQYLIKAEAKAHLQDITGAQDALNVIRTRAGLPNTTAATADDLLAAVARERQAELFAEWGHRWLDLKRTGKATDVLGAIPAKQPFNATQLLLPIPPSELQNDPNLTPNPGY